MSPFLSSLWATAKSSLHLLGEVRVGPLGVAYLLYGVCTILAALRWQQLLRGVGQKVRLREPLAINLMSVLTNNVVPGRVPGELFRIAMLRMRTGVSVGKAAAASTYDRVLDVVPLTVMTLLALPIVWPLIGNALVKASAPALRYLAVGVLVLLALFLLIKLGHGRSQALRERLRALSQRLRSAHIARKPLLYATGASFAMYLLDAVRYSQIASALQVELSPGRALLLAVIATMAGLLPSLGGIGAIEGGLTIALVQFGVPLERALAIALLERLASYVLVNVIAAVLLLLLGGVGVIRALRAAPASPRS
jgi:uncharacterized protein (TIRG00374 family)